MTNKAGDCGYYMSCKTKREIFQMFMFNMWSFGHWVNRVLELNFYKIVQK